MDPRLQKLLNTKTVAVDLDGTLADTSHACNLNEPGPPLPYAREAMQEFKNNGWQVIIFTCRSNPEAAAWLKKHSIPFDYINVNPREAETFQYLAPKVHADLYIDDKAYPMCGEFVGWQKVIADLEQRGILGFMCQCKTGALAPVPGRCSSCSGHIGFKDVKSAKNS